MAQQINDVEKTDEEYDYYDNDRQYNLDDSQIESSNLYTGRQNDHLGDYRTRSHRDMFK